MIVSKKEATNFHAILDLTMMVFNSGKDGTERNEGNYLLLLAS